jgi:hypothetical protein
MIPKKGQLSKLISIAKQIIDESITKKTVALGIRFEQMSPQMSGLRMVFVSLLKIGESSLA